MPTDRINQGFVLGNKVMVGTVNAHRDDFVEGIEDMLRAEATFPGWLDQGTATHPRGRRQGPRHTQDAIKAYPHSEVALECCPSGIDLPSSARRGEGLTSAGIDPAGSARASPAPECACA